MKNFTQESLDIMISKTVLKKHLQGAVFHIESLDKSLSFISGYGNLYPESQYYIASINKLIISFITLRLCQNKLIDLDDKLSQHLPAELLDGILIYGGTDHSHKLTIRHLISHTSGLPCYLIDKRPDGKKNMNLMLNGDDQSWPLDKVVNEVKKMKSKFIPGTKGKANYSETNFRLLGRVLEQVTGKRISELLSDVFSELNMNDTCVLPSNTATNCAQVYFRQNPVTIAAYWKSTGHDIASTAVDQMKFIRAFFSGDYFTKAYINELKQWNSIFFPFKYGIGIQLFYIPRILTPFKAVPEIIGHCGSVGSIAFYIPEKEVFITGTVNQAGNPNTAFQTMIRILNKL